MRVAIYVRVSSEMQLDGYSLDAQENACQSFAALRGWQVVKLYREEGASAKSMERPVFQQMIAAAARGEFDVLLVHKLDRFSRKLKDMIGIIDYFDEIDVALVSATEQFDLSTPQGRMMVNVMSSVNQWYLDNLSQEISKGKRQRAKSGDWNGTLSYGYTTPARLREALHTTKDKDKLGIIASALDNSENEHDTAAIIDPFNQGGVILAFEQYATGKHTFQQIADILNEAGYRCNSRDGTGLFSQTMISELLRNKFYLGMTSYGAKVKGARRKWMDGNHDAIISKELFDKVQSVRKGAAGDKAKAHNRARPYPLTPLLVQLENEKRWRGRYRKNKREYVREAKDGLAGTSINADELEAAVMNALKGISIPDNWQQLVLKDMNMSVDSQPSVNVDAMKQRMERLKKLFVLGDISEDEYLAQRDEIKPMIQPKRKAIIHDIDDLQMVVNVFNNLDMLWSVATLEEKDRLAKLLFNRLYIKEKSLWAIEPSAMFSHLLEATVTAMRGGQDSNIHRGPQIVQYGISIYAVRKMVS